ncbi:dTDP-4-dehydrorhamnose reductase family protein [Leptospira kanakyensis]|uniref:dTDP-4-dehydrorhamnose reductase family protein n=1 Tax=Leptospira kanakyensis TaxID=2484968 RepID=UPI00223CA4CA|nr:SDR family oxidoreductase [Leptospira kanakyensis]MCW7482113.1 SDR family oxidoreductase [Leptospira kanakyensis]
MNKKILILGAGGMLGSTLFRLLPEYGHNVFGTLRQSKLTQFVSKVFPNSDNLIYNIDVLNSDQLSQAIVQIEPDVIINCIGIIKQLDIANDPLYVIPINSLLPYRLSDLAERFNAKLIHISTDCVFDGKKGNYFESDKPNADDLYGKSKELGEIKDRSHVLTLRTSLIGHELHSSHSLVDWFLTQNKSVNGYTKAIFSGLTTIEMAKVIHNHIISKSSAFGLYHLAVNPISKFELLTLIKEIYKKEIEVFPSDIFQIDRSLNSERFNRDFIYNPPDWKQLIQEMKEYHDKYKGSFDV